jgi:hypothetical protein
MKVDLDVVECEYVYVVDLTQDAIQPGGGGGCDQGNESTDSVRRGEFLRLVNRPLSSQERLCYVE